MHDRLGTATSKRHDKMFLCTANLSALDAMLVSYMRPFFVFLGLLLCLIPIQAGEQMVIKDSEAIRNVGRYVEVCGLVVSVTASPLGTTFINFGGDTQTRRSPGSFQPIRELRLTKSQISKGKTYASSVQSNFTRGNRRSKSCRCIRS